MVIAINAWDDISAVCNSILEDCLFVVRESYILPTLVKQFNNMSGANLRKGFNYNQTSAGTLTEFDDLTSSAFAATAGETLTPKEIGLQVMISDLRKESDTMENIVSDTAKELAFAAGDKIETDLLANFTSLTGASANYYTGTIIGTPTFGALAGMIAIAQNKNKSSKVPLAAVVHGYHWKVLAASASVAGASVAVAPNFQDRISSVGYVGQFMGVPIYQYYGDVTGTTATAWTNCAVFSRDAMALDWRRGIRIEAERNASARGTEFNMSAVYATGVWRPTLGVYGKMFAALPTT